MWHNISGVEIVGQDNMESQTNVSECWKT